MLVFSTLSTFDTIKDAVAMPSSVRANLISCIFNLEPSQPYISN